MLCCADQVSETSEKHVHRSEILPKGIWGHTISPFVQIDMK